MSGPRQATRPMVGQKDLQSSPRKGRASHIWHDCLYPKSKPFACSVIIPRNVYSCIGKCQCVQLAACVTRRCLPFFRFQRHLYKRGTGCPIGPPLGTTVGTSSSGPQHCGPSALEACRSVPAGQLARRRSPSYRRRKPFHSWKPDVDGSQQLIECTISDDDLVLLAEWGDLGIEVGTNIPAGRL